MSEVSRGPDWWLASDGRRYPPEVAPAPSGVPAPPPPTAAPRGSPVVKKWWFWAACALVVLLLVVVAAGVFSSPGKATKVGASNGYTQFADHTDSFSIAVPSSWRQVDPSSPGAEAAFQEMTTQNPSLRKAFGNGFSDVVSAGIKFLAVDPDPADVASGGSPTINVIVHPAPGSTDADLGRLSSGITGEYQQLGLHLVDTSTVHLAGHRALRMHVGYTVTAADGSTSSVPETQYFVLANDFAYIITLAFSSPRFDQVMSTFAVH
ncbi:MAG TPA: PsbP-related protein [Acidimicrobiales bacterium]|nr:PsbP-related protein [Acidimicrobiales bacterium]